MSVNRTGTDPGFACQICDQAAQRRLLLGGRTAAVEVAHKADADAVLVKEIAGAPYAEVAPRSRFAVRAGLLTLPARPHKNLAIRIVHAVADHEVVSQAVPPTRAMVCIHALGRVLVVGRMVHHDHLPQPAAHAAARREPRFVQRPIAVGGVVGRRLRLESVCRRAADRPRLGSRERCRQWRRGPRDYRRLRQGFAAHRLRPLAARRGRERDQGQHAQADCVSMNQQLRNPLHRVALRPGGILAVGAETELCELRTL